MATAAQGERIMRRRDLSTPRERRRLGVHYDTGRFGQFSETIARFIGTARFLVFQSVVCIGWVVWNTLLPQSARFDEWPFIGLTLALSLQAAYAAPLILLAQSRQEQRDRMSADNDRRLAERNQADTEYLARELAALRVGLADVPTGSELADHLEQLAGQLGSIAERLEALDHRQLRDAQPTSFSSP
jgi:uncharacterized membrane protein